MAEPTAFPAFIRAEYDPSGNGFREFESAFAQSAQRAERQFTASFDEIGKRIGQALNRGLGANGRIEIDTGALRQAAADARFSEQAFDSLIRTATLLARETGDTTDSTRRYIQALSAQKIESAQAARAAETELATYSRLQAGIDATSDAQSRLAQAYRETFAEAARLAQVEVSQGNANRQIGNTIAPAMGSRAIDNGAGYAELERAAIAADKYERELAELRQQVDPLAFEIQRVTKSIELANTAMARGDLTAEQHAQAVQQLNTSLSQMRGGLRDTRQGMVMVGQQTQDLVISLISGQRAGTVLAQQLPQLTFALTSFGGKVGAVATALSGPFASIGLVAASFGLGILIENLMGAEDATDKAGKATETFADTLNREKHSLDEVTKALDDYYKAKERGREIDIENSQRAAKRIADHLNEAIAIRQKLQAQLEADMASAAANAGQGTAGAAGAYTGGQASISQAALDANTKALNDLIEDSRGAVVDVAEQMAALQSDNTENIKTGFKVLRDEARASIKDIDALTKRLAELNRQEEAAIDAINKAQREANKKPSTSLPNVTLREVTQLISGQLGSTITSTTGGKHVKGSYHYSGQAVDFVPKGGMGSLTKDDIRKAFAAEGIQLKELLGPGDKGHDDHFHAAFAKRRQSVEQVNDAIERANAAAEKAAQQLQDGIDRSAESVSRLRGQFDEAPRDIDRAAAAVIDLNQAIADADAKLKAGGLTDEQKKVVEATKAKAIDTKKNVLPEFLKRPLNRELSDLSEQIDLQQMLIDGRQADADVMQDMLDLARMLGAESLDQLDTQIKQRGISEEQLDAYFQQRAELRLQTVELDRQRQKQQLLLGVVEDVSSAAKSAIYDMFDGKGLGAAKNFVKDLFDIQKRALTEEIYEALLGDAFQKQKLKILGLDKVDETGRAMAAAMKKTISPLEELAAAARDAAAALNGVPANDNAPNPVDPTAEIVVTGQRSIQREFKDSLKGLTNSIFGEELAGKIGDAAGQAFRGAAVGQAASGMLRSLGIKQSALGSQIGGAIGSFLPIPGGDIIGGVVGGTIGGLFKKTPKGSATITSLEDADYRGTGKLREGVMGLAGGVQSSLSRIVDALNADLGDFRVSIGQRKKSFVVDPSGQGRTKGSGVQKFASEEEAVAAAIRDALMDGAVKGLRAGAQRLLQAGKDLDAQLQKAVDFQSVFDRLRAYKDPVGAALDTLDREFNRLKKIFGEAGATTAEYAELEELYGIERAKAIKEASERLTASLKSLYDDLTIGDNGRSLRDRLAAAQAAYDPLKARVAAGDRSAYDDFAQAAQALLDIQRQFSGSQSPYFNLLDEITNITKARIDAESNIASIAANRDSPFTSTGQVANDNYAPVVGAIENQTQQLLNGWAVIMGQWQQAAMPAGFLTQRFGSL